MLNQFCKNTAIPACGYLLRKSKIERFFWIACLTIGLISIIYIMVDISQEWRTESVYITLDASSHHINDVEFPGVALCDMNKISKQRAERLAYQLMNVTGKKHEFLLDLIQLFGHFYDNNIQRTSQFSELQNIMNIYDNGTTEAHLVKHLSGLITPCNDLLLNCSWNSRRQECSDLFQVRLTDNGFCCVFNYIRKSSEAILLSDINSKVPTEPRKYLGTGVAKGLLFTVNNNISDYFYTTMATRGSILKIFLPRDFPDLISGSLRQLIIQEKTEVFIRTEADTLQTLNNLRTLSMKQRNCKFADEETTAFGNYSSSNCFVTCKIRSIIALCNCIPVTVPVTEGTNTDGVPFCNLVNIPCLNRYQGTFGGIASILLGVSIINIVEIGVIVSKILVSKLRGE